MAQDKMKSREEALEDALKSIEKMIKNRRYQIEVDDL